MLSPEIFNFEAPHSTFKVEKIRNGENIVDNPNINKFHYNHMVSVTLPNLLKNPDSLCQKLTADCEYYKICDLNPSELLNLNFTKSFVKNGKVTLLSINTRIDCDNCISVTPCGCLMLSVDKETYESLGLVGKVSHFTKRTKNKYNIKIDLKQNWKKETGMYERILSRLRTLGDFTVIILWEPFAQNVCPSSVAKYFCDIGYKVKVCCPNVTSNTAHATIPTLPFNGDSEDLAEFVEWLGMVNINSNVASSAGVRNLRVLLWRGLFSIDKIKELIKQLMAYTVDIEWISVYVQGFSDSPVAWGFDEHHYFTNGDNGYIAVLNKNESLLGLQKCSQKRYQS